MDNATQRLADGVWRIDVGRATNAYVVANDGASDSDGLTLVDTGWPHSGPRLIRSIRLAGLDPTSITTVLLTHWHGDHTGSAARLERSSAEVTFHAGEADLEVIRGEQRRPFAAAPAGDVSWFGKRFGDALSTRAEPVPAVLPLAGGTTLDVAGGLHVIATPGHTPGHLSFWLPAAGALLAGDALMNLLWPTRGVLFVRTARHSEAASLAALAALDPTVVGVGHGPPITSGARQRLLRLAARASARTPAHSGEGRTP